MAGNKSCIGKKSRSFPYLLVGSGVYDSGVWSNDHGVGRLLNGLVLSILPARRPQHATMPKHQGDAAQEDDC